MGISLLHITEPCLILLNDNGGVYFNQVNGCSCDTKQVSGYCVPLSIKPEFYSLYDPVANYLCFEFNEKSCRESLETSSYIFDIKNIEFNLSEIVEAWVPLSFTSKILFRNLSDENENLFTELSAAKLTEFAEPSEIHKEKYNRLEVILNEKVKNHRFNAILTWQNSD